MRALVMSAAALALPRLVQGQSAQTAHRSLSSLSSLSKRTARLSSSRRSVVGLALATFTLLLLVPSTVASSPGSERQCSAQASAALSTADQIKEKVEANSVLVFSKSYCPYCAQVKALFKSLGIEHKVIELDQTADGAEVQGALVGITGSRTVPQVFVGGVFIGGADDTTRQHRTGKLEELLTAAGVTINSNADVVL